MSPRIVLIASLVLLALGITVVIVDAQRPPGGRRAPAALAGTGFTYQGQLKSNGALVNNTCDFQFGLWDSSTLGTQVGTTQTVNSLSVTNGLFTTPPIDFGNNAFQGDGRWLGIAVSCPSGGSFTALSPRQQLMPAPYALALPGLYTTQNITSPNIIGGFNGNTVDGGVWAATIGGGGQSGLINHISANFGTIGGGYSNTIPITGIIATIGGGGANTASGNTATIGGGSNNIASGNGATIGGGSNNIASGNFATIGGGSNNIVSGFFAVFAIIGGGVQNTASGGAATIGGGAGNTASGDNATIAGGANNTASGLRATVGGGFVNTASGNYATIGGGSANTASGLAAIIPGGYSNVAVTYSLAAGRQAKANHQGTFVWADCNPCSGVGTDFASSADNQFLIRTAGGVGINTTTPNATLGVNGNVRLNDNDIYLRGNSDTNHGIGWYGPFKQFASNGVDGPVVYGYSGGALGTNESGTQNIALSWNASNNVTVTGKLRANGGFNGQCLGAGNFSTTASNACNMDIAEAFAATELTQPGDLVVLVTQNVSTPTVRQSTQAYEGLVIGVVSTNPGLVFDNGETHLAGDNSQLITANKTIVALVGRVPVKVSMENGAIAIGDPLTSSSRPGVAMKATKVGKIIGYALQAAERDGIALTLIQPGNYLPPEQLALQQQNAALEARVAALEQAARDPKGFQNPSGLGDWNAAIALVIGAVGVIAFERARKGGSK